MSHQRSRATLVGVVVALFSLLAALNASLYPFGFPDEVEYWKLAKNLIEHGTLSLNGSDPSAYRPPFVAWILAPVFATGVQMATARPLFVVFYAATGALSGYFLCRVFASSRWVPPLGTAFVLGNPLYFFSAGNLYPQQILTPLFLAAAILICLDPSSPRVVILRSISVGAITAVSLLASAPALFSILPVFAFLAWEDWKALRERKIFQAHRLVVAGAVVVLCVAPYVVRNSRNVHQGFYLSLNSGINLLLGNSPLTTPTSGISVDLSEHMQGHANESEFDANRRLTQAALANIRLNPGYYARLYLQKFVAGFGNTVQTVTHGYNEPATLALSGYMALVWIGTAFLFFSLFFRHTALQTLSCIDWPLLRTFGLLVLASYLLSMAGYALFFTRLRFRIPVDTALAILAAVGWAALLTSKRQKD